MLREAKSASSLGSELSEDRQTAISSSNTLTSPEDDICARLDRVNAWRLDRQCAAPRRSGGMLELSDILHKASRIQAHRLTNQDYTPRRSTQTDTKEVVEQPLKVPKEALLASIASRLGRLTGVSDSNRCIQCTGPREHTKRLVLLSIEKLHRVGVPTMRESQRILRQPID
ncbi:hypothetical protein GGI07_002682 [Coemansia sp. Benny D115]|nr:hypothetical protein GGI07_002682 [Coemansia sp. Benny D115]